MQRIRCALVAREGVNRCHVTSLDTDRLVEDIRHWGEAVRRAGRIRDDRMARVQLVVVDTVDQRQIGAKPARRPARLAPASKCFEALSLSVKMPVHSIAISTSSSFHGSFAGSRSAVTFILPLPKSIQYRRC